MNKKYLKIAYEYAQKFSQDPSTQNGAILVNDKGEVLVKGANLFPKGIILKKERLERPLKYCFITHAERNVIFNAARKGIKTKGLIMYCPWAACPDCARAIIQAGIKKVITHKKMLDKTPDRWKDKTNIAQTMFKEAGVEFEIWNGEIGNIEIKFNSKPFTP
ncbi:MAG: deaminase [Patescibacteria group bacterium]|nr:CMP deaminase [Patescibacteria group bacterium]